MSLKSVRCLMLLVLAAALVPSALFAATPSKEPSVAESAGIVKNSRDAQQKLNAIKRLGNVTEADERNYAIAELLTNVVKTTDNPFIGDAAAEVLATLQKNVTKRPKVIYIPILIPVLKDARSLPLIRYAIASLFCETLDKEGLPDRQAFQLLQEIAKNRTEQNLGLRGKCTEAVGAFGDPDAIALLAEILADPDPFMKEAASKALAMLLEKNPDVGPNVKLATVNKLIEMMKDLKDKPQSLDLHVIIIRVVAQLIAANAPGANAGLEEIVKLVTTSKEDKVVSAGIDGLGVIGTKEAVEPLIKTYADFSADPGVDMNVLHRNEVIKALGQVLLGQASRQTSDLATVHKIAALLIKVVGTDVNVGVRESAVLGLGYLYPAKFKDDHWDAAFALVGLMQDADKNLEPVKPLAAKALAAILPVNFGKEPLRWLEYLTKNKKK